MIAPTARRIPAVVLILGATLISGIVSYVITWLVPWAVGFEAYAAFALYWSALYLLIGTLSGVQQEITRATVIQLAPSGEPNRARGFGLAAIGLVGVGVLITGLAWAPLVFPNSGWALALPIAVGTAGYVAVAVLSGTLYGLARWGWIAAFVLIDALLRLALVALALLFTQDVLVLAWTVALPFPAVFLLLWPALRRRVVGKAQLDVGYRQLASNVLHTVAGAAATAVMVSGFPLFLGVTSQPVSAAVLGMVILAVTFVRAPLVVVAMSLQSYLVLRFREHPPTRRLGVLAAVVALVGGAALALAGALMGPPVFAWLFPAEPVPDAGFIAALCGSSVLVAALYITGSGVLAAGQHRVYLAGWLTGAVATVVLLLVPGEIVTRSVIALLVAPALGVAVHIAGAWRRA